MAEESIGIRDTGIYMPEGVADAAELSEKTKIPEQVIIEKFGLVQKHVADDETHVSDLAARAARPLLDNISPLDIDVLIYFGSPHKDYPVWVCATKVQHELGLKNAFVFEIMNVSAGFPIALKVAKDMLAGDKSLNNILLVGGCKESQIIDYGNERSRFMFNFGDGGAAALIGRENTRGKILNSSIITDGSFHDDVKIPAGGTVLPATRKTAEERLHYIDVKDPVSMKERLDKVSLQNFVKVTEKAVRKSGFTMDEVDWIIPLHTKKSMFRTLLGELHLSEEKGVYLDHYGHMSSLDPCVGLQLLKEEGKLRKNDVIVTLSAGTGYTWAATVIQWE